MFRYASYFCIPALDVVTDTAPLLPLDTQNKMKSTGRTEGQRKDKHHQSSPHTTRHHKHHAHKGKQRSKYGLSHALAFHTTLIDCLILTLIVNRFE